MAQAHPLPPPQRRRCGRGFVLRRADAPRGAHGIPAEALRARAPQQRGSHLLRVAHGRGDGLSPVQDHDDHVLQDVQGGRVPPVGHQAGGSQGPDGRPLPRQRARVQRRLPPRHLRSRRFPLLDPDYQTREPDAQARGEDQAADRRRGARPGSESTHRGGRHDRGFRAKLTHGFRFRHADKRRSNRREANGERPAAGHRERPREYERSPRPAPNANDGERSPRPAEGGEAGDPEAVGDVRSRRRARLRRGAER